MLSLEFQLKKKNIITIFLKTLKTLVLHIDISNIFDYQEDSFTSQKYHQSIVYDLNILNPGFSDGFCFLKRKK